MKDVTSRYKGAFFVLLSAFLYGFIPILAVFAYKKDVSVMSFHLVRFTIASVALFACFIYGGESCADGGQEEPFSIIHTWRCPLYLTSFSYFSSFKYIPASMAALIFYSYPALVSVGSSYINKEYLSITLILAIGVSFTGLVFLSGKLRFQSASKESCWPVSGLYHIRLISFTETPS